MNMKNNVLYFAYGINMFLETFQKRCPNYKFIGTAFLPNYRIGFTRESKKQKGGVADIIKAEKSDKTWGVLYEISEEGLNILDKYEGYPFSYSREKKTVFLLESINNLNDLVKKDDVWVYYVKDKSKFIKPNSEYLNKITEAAYYFSFPLDYIIQLKKYSMKTIQEKNLFSELVELSDVIRKNNLKNLINIKNEWGGADVLITSSIKRKNEFKRNYPDKICVLTRFSIELSWLFFKLRDLYEHRIDYLNKYFFYGKLAKAANNYLMKCDKNKKIEKREDLLMEVFNIAYSFYDNFER